MTATLRLALPALLLMSAAPLAQEARAQELTPDQSVLRAGPQSFSALATRLAPAVVNISTAQTVTYAGGMPEFPPDSPLERFNEFFGGPGGSRVSNSLGSGFVIDPDGVIVTNNHVIEGADTVAINFVDGSSLDAEVVGVDPATDLAVLRVSSPDPLPFVEFGDSDAALVGDWVVAIGNPFGLGGTLTQGIISARNRQGIAGAYDDFIQTDAAINRGNSGGPLFAMDGRVIGVNTAILSTTGANVGIAFSVPSNIAAPIVSQILEYGVARRGWLGVSARDVSAQLADEAGLDSRRGAVLSSITEDGPAESAGLQADDIVLTVDGRDIENSNDLQRVVAQIGVGDTVEVEYIRDGDRRTARVTVAELESDTPAQSRPQQAAGPQSLDVLGMTLTSLSNADRGRLGLAPDVRGVLVSSVDADSDAGGKVREDDVIEEIAWEPVANLTDAQARIDAAMEQDVAQIQVVINRRGSLLVRSIQVD